MPVVGGWGEGKEGWTRQLNRGVGKDKQEEMDAIVEDEACIWKGCAKSMRLAR